MWPREHFSPGEDAPPKRHWRGQQKYNQKTGRKKPSQRPHSPDLLKKATPKNGEPKATWELKGVQTPGPKSTWGNSYKETHIRRNLFKDVESPKPAQISLKGQRRLLNGAFQNWGVQKKGHNRNGQKSELFHGTKWKGEKPFFGVARKFAPKMGLQKLLKNPLEKPCKPNWKK